MFERVGFGCCPTTTLPLHRLAATSTSNMTCASCVDRFTHRVPEMDLTADREILQQINVDCHALWTPMAKRRFLRVVILDRAVSRPSTISRMLILVAAGRTLELAAVRSLEVGTQAAAAIMAAGNIGASCQTDVLCWRAAASGCIDAPGLQFIYRRLEAREQTSQSCSVDGVFRGST